MMTWSSGRGCSDGMHLPCGIGPSYTGVLRRLFSVREKLRSAPTLLRRGRETL
jgi:hypothetical protein